jgi:hypothetical protein
MKKGLDTLLSAVILIGIVVVTGVIITGFANDLFKTESRSIENRTGSCIGSDITIQEVYLDLQNEKARASVRNSGFSGENIMSAVMLSKEGKTAGNATELPVYIAKSGLVNIEFNLSGKIAVCSDFNKIIISTECASDQSSSEPKCIS